MKSKILILLLIITYSCNNEPANNNIGNVENKGNEVNFEVKKVSDSLDLKSHETKIKKEVKNIIKDNLLNCFTKENELKHIEDDFLFVYEDFSLSLYFDVEQQMNYLIHKNEMNTDKYHLKNDDYDAGEFKIWSYKLGNNYMFLLELDDYYSSLFYIYLYNDNILTRLGDLSLDQPNVEDTGVKTESFKICKENNTILIECYLDEKLVSTHKLKIEEKNILKKVED